MMKTSIKKQLTKIARAYQLYLMLLIPVAMVFIFCYYPMYGAQIAFKKYNIVDGVFGSPWVGLMWLENFVSGKMFLELLGNTLILNLYSLSMGFPLSIADKISAK